MTVLESMPSMPGMLPIVLVSFVSAGGEAGDANRPLSLALKPEKYPAAKTAKIRTMNPEILKIVVRLIFDLPELIHACL